MRARVTLLLAALAHAVAAAVAQLGLAERPPRASGGPASVRTTWANNRRLWSTSRHRRLFVAIGVVRCHRV